MKRTLFSICFISIAILINAAKVDTLEVYSNSMKKSIKTCIIVPETYSSTGESYPVLYLLAAYGTDHTTWVNPGILELSDKYNIIFVGVDGGHSSWYFDSPIDSAMKYETYVAKELISFIDATFNTIKSRKGRAIMGASMGGHGALYLVMRHQNIFGAAGSMSGVIDIRQFPTGYDLAKRLGDKALFPENWEKNTVLAQLYLCKKDNLAFIIDCGVNDPQISSNRELHDMMLYFRIDHDYIERPGGHNVAYWMNSFPYQILFFNNFSQRE